MPRPGPLEVHPTPVYPLILHGYPIDLQHGRLLLGAEEGSPRQLLAGGVPRLAQFAPAGVQAVDGVGHLVFVPQDEVHFVVVHRRGDVAWKGHVAARDRFVGDWDLWKWKKIAYWKRY